MRRYRRYLLGALLAGVAWPALAQSLGMGLGLDSVDRPGAGAVLDTFTAPAAAYSFRKVRSAYAGPAVKLRRTTGGTSDIGFTAGGDFDAAAAATFCAATTCFLDTWYDQSTNARHALQATAANQPQYIADCGGGLPCARIVTAAGAFKYMETTSQSWTVKTSFSAVGKRNSGLGPCHWSRKGPTNDFYTYNVAGQWTITDSISNSFTMAATDGAFHAGIAIIDGAGSLARVDGTEIAGAPITGSATAGTLTVAFAEPLADCDQREAIVWDNYALTLSERQALTENQRSYWMPLPLDTFAIPAAAYSMRRLKSSYAGPAIRLRRASDNAETDINFLGFTGFTGAPLDTAAANAHCAATTCYLTAWYDQSGGARHNLATSVPAQPQYVADCGNGLPCARITGGGQFLQYVPATPGATMTFSTVGKRTGVGDCYWISNNSANFLIAKAANTLQLSGAAGAATAPATDGAWHAGIGVMSGASSLVRVDATEGTPASVTAGLAAGQAVYLVAFAGASTQCDMSEAVLWDLYTLTASERAALTANQRSFWSIP